MFFNPKDVKFFKPIEVRSKMGLRVIFCINIGTNIIIIGNSWFDEGDVQRQNKTQRYSLHVFVQQSVPDC
jgi:hypothetical protein